MLALLDEGEGLDREDVRRLKVRKEGTGRVGGKEGGKDVGRRRRFPSYLYHFTPIIIFTQAINPTIMVRVHTRALATAAV